MEKVTKLKCSRFGVPWDPCCVHQLCVMDPLSLSPAVTQAPTKSLVTPCMAHHYMSMHLSSLDNPTLAHSSAFFLSLSAVSCPAAGDLLWSRWGERTLLVPFLSQECKWRQFWTIPACGDLTRESKHQLTWSNCPVFFLSCYPFCPGIFKRSFH